MKGDLYITGDPDGDGLLNTDPLALLIGMLLDQQVPMEWAFSAPRLLAPALRRAGLPEHATATNGRAEESSSRLASR